MNVHVATILGLRLIAEHHSYDLLGELLLLGQLALQSLVLIKLLQKHQSYVIKLKHDEIRQNKPTITARNLIEIMLTSSLSFSFSALSW